MQGQLPRPSKAKYDESRKMMALQFRGKEDVKVAEVPVPVVTDATDVIVRVTASSIGGSDLHLYHNQVPKMDKGDIVGHESVGIVDEVGSAVKNFKKGDRVVISAVISCGKCHHCKRGEWSCCEANKCEEQGEEEYGYRTSASLGSGHLMGGYDGCQAEYVRVPFADINLFPIPANVPDRQAICIADIACTSYHATELAEVGKGDKVVVFGCGPVGLLTLMWTKYRGASRIIAVDVDTQRLSFAKEKFGAEIINPDDGDVVKAVHDLMPGGPDKVIDCVGFCFPETALKKVELKLKSQTDVANIVNDAIKMIRKNGKISIVGDYIGFTDHFNIGAFLEKHLTMNGGQHWPHKYYKLIFDAISSGAVDPSVVMTHTYPLSKIDEVYKMFDEHQNGMIKPLVLPDSIYNKAHIETQ